MASSIVRLGTERVENVSTTDFPGYLPNTTSTFTLDQFKKQLSVCVTVLSESEIEFELIGVDPSLANAIRRITIAEVATVAIETVYVWNNTSIVQDEVLAQRLGLVPLSIDPNLIEFKANADEAPTDLNTVVFNLVAKCERRKDVKKGETNPDLIWTGSRVLSSQLVFDPKGSQDDLFKNQTPTPAVNDILLAKMRGGQEIVAELHCNKGLGKEHAKWSPVATASYRLLPTITLTGDIPTHLHSKFQACFPRGVIDISSGEIVVADARKDTVSREVLRHPEFEGKVQLGRVRDHFLFSIESAGQYKPERLVPEAIKVLLNKIRTVRAGLHKLQV